MRALIEDLPQLDLHGDDFTQRPQLILQSLLATSPLVQSRRGLEVLDYAWIGHRPWLVARSHADFLPTALGRLLDALKGASNATSRAA